MRGGVQRLRVELLLAFDELALVPIGTDVGSHLREGRRMDKHSYRTRVQWTSERKGSLSSEGLPGFDVATPPQFPGGHEGIWSPEHLFTAAAEACLMTTFLAVATNSKLEFREYSSTAEGILEKTESGFLMTEIILRPRVVVAADQVDRAKRVLEKAERNCLISNSMKSRVTMIPEVVAG